MCVDRRAWVLDNEPTFERLVMFLLDSPRRYQWYGRRFVVMPDHVHLIARMGDESIPLGQWIKALKAVVGGIRSGVAQDSASRSVIAGAADAANKSIGNPELSRVPRQWRWQAGYHDHKIRSPESEAEKWEYVCMNPVRYGLVERPEDWPFGGEIFDEDAAGATLVRGTPALLNASMVQNAPPKP